MRVDFASDPQEIWGLFSTLEGDVAFDVGANGGMVAGMLAGRFAAVVAVEPCRESYMYLAEHAPTNVVCLPVALSDRDGTVVLLETSLAGRMGELVTGHSLPQPWGPITGEREVLCWTVDRLAAQYGTPDLLKIDTEGHEVHVLLGAAETLRSRPRLIIEVHSESNGAEIIDMLDGWDTQVVRHPAYAQGSYYWRNHYFVLHGV